MDKQIKRLLLTELSSERNLAKSLNKHLPVNVTRTRSRDDNDNVKSFYMLHFDKYNDIFYFACIFLDDFLFHPKEGEIYTIDDLKQELNLAEVWFEPFY